MTDSELSKLVLQIEVIYPFIYQDFGLLEHSILRDMWEKLLKEYSYNEAYKAIIQYLKNDSEGIPPTPGQIRAILKGDQDE